MNLTRAEIQAKQDSLDMFCEDAVDRRVRIGMHEDKESGEWVFGTQQSHPKTESQLNAVGCHSAESHS